MILNSIQSINRHLYISIALVFLILILIFSNPYFVTCDGAAHLYNANLFSKLLSNNDFLSGIYSLNPIIPPNYLTTLLYLILDIIFIPSISEKLIITSIFFITLFSIWGIIKSTKGNNRLAIILVPILLFNYLLAIGMNNFMLGVSLMFLSIYLYLSYNFRYNIYRIIIFSFIIFLLFLSHGLVFLITLAILTFLEFTNQFNLIKKNDAFKLANLKNYLILFIVFMPSLILFMFYTKSQNYINQNTFLDFETIISYIIDFRVLLAYVPIERICSKLIFIPFFTIFIIHTYLWILKVKSISIIDKLDQGRWLLLTVILILSMFILPDETNGGGYVTLRLQLIAMFFIIIWLSYSKADTNFFVICLVIIYIPFLISLYSKIVVQKDLNNKIGFFLEAEKIIPPNSVIYTIRHSDNWLDGHFSNYLGINKAQVILDNYEVGTGYFPVVRKNDQNRCVILPFEYKSLLENSNFGICNGSDGIKIDYVLEYGHLPFNQDQKTLIDSVKQNGELIFGRDAFNIYKLNY